MKLLSLIVVEKMIPVAEVRYWSVTLLLSLFSPSSLSLLTLEASLNACIEAKLLNEKLKVIVVLTGCSANHLVKDTKESRDLIADMLSEYEDVILADNFITTRKNMDGYCF